jgi:Protein of unknown function (DUF3375)
MTLGQLRQGHPAWRLLSSPHAPLVASFLHRAFIAPNVRVMAQADLTERLEDELFSLRERVGTQPFPREAGYAGAKHGAVKWLKVASAFPSCVGSSSRLNSKRLPGPLVICDSFLQLVSGAPSRRSKIAERMSAVVSLPRPFSNIQPGAGATAAVSKFTLPFLTAVALCAFFRRFGRLSQRQVDELGDA